MVAIPLGLGLLVLFGVVVAAGRKEKRAEGGMDDRLAEQRQAEAALAGVPGAEVRTTAKRRRSRSARPAASKGQAISLGEGDGGGPAAGAKVVVRKTEGTDEEFLGMTRRQILNRGVILSTIAGLGGFGGASLAFLWPKLSGGFGSVVTAGAVDEIKAQIQTNKEPYYNPSGRFYLMAYDPSVDDSEGDTLYPQIFAKFKEVGLIAMYQKCPHLGCRVPYCKSSGWFECPCHGSKYNSAGEWQAGPAPRGMWHMPLKLDGSTLSVDTGTQVEGPPKGTNTQKDSEAKGPHCVGI